MAAGTGGGWARGTGTGGSTSNPDDLQFPAVPYGPDDFNQPQCPIDDLALSKQYVRDKAVEFMNRLVDLGVAGFRVDTVKVNSFKI